jgi:tryptophan-rich sensory protein
MSNLKSAAGLGVSLLLCFAAAAFGARVTAPAIRTWYPELRKPSWTPPAGVFGPVWSALYLAMAVAAWLAWRRADMDCRAPPLRLFATQLVLNVAWSALFFGRKQPGVAFVEILALWTAIAATTVSFWRTSRPAGLLLIPYLAWVTFASALNLAIWRKNR